MAFRCRDAYQAPEPVVTEVKKTAQQWTAVYTQPVLTL